MGRGKTAPANTTVDKVDIAIIGAGPQALTLVTHLLQKKKSMRQRFVVLADGRELTAKRVVLAISGGKPHLPAWVQSVPSHYPHGRLLQPTPALKNLPCL